MKTLIIFIIIILLIITFLYYNKIRIKCGKLLKWKFYPSIFVPEMFPIIYNKDIIKKELKDALNLPVYNICRYKNNWHDSISGKQFMQKVNNITGWIYGSENNDNNDNNNNDENNNNGWLNFGLIHNNKTFDANSKICPNTCNILKNIKGINIAGFSLLKPNSKILPHKDHSGIKNNSVTIHYGLIIPEENKCNLIVDNEIKYQEEDKLIIFDSNYIHYAENNSDKDRIILYIDKSLT